MTIDKAKELASNHLYFGAGMLGLGHADVCVAGAFNTSGDVARAALFCVGTAKGVQIMSSFFMMVKGNEILSYADGAIMPNPTAEELPFIAATTAKNH